MGHDNDNFKLVHFKNKFENSFYCISRPSSEHVFFVSPENVFGYALKKTCFKMSKSLKGV